MPRASRRSMPAPAPRSRRGPPRRSSSASPPSPASVSAWRPKPRRSRASSPPKSASPSRRRGTSSNGRAAAPRFLPRRDRARAGARARARRGHARGARLPRAARRRGQHLGVELSVVRGQQRVRAGARRRQRGALQALGARHPHRTGNRAPAARERRARGRVHPGDRRGRGGRGARGPATWTACSSPGPTRPGGASPQALGARAW